MKCPNCKEVSLSMTDRSGIEIDFCPECRGVWLDRGELDKLIEKSKAAFEPATSTAPQQPAPQLAQQPIHYGHPGGQHPSGYYYKGKKRKSFLEDLFD